MAREAPLDLAGALAPVVTAFDSVTGDLDVVSHRENLRRWMASDLLGVVVAGSTGEAVLLDEDELGLLVETSRPLVPEDRLLVVGTGAEATRSVVGRTRRAAEAGADAVLVKPPAYYRGEMTPEVLRAHFQEVADASPVPVILYQVPLRFATLELSTGLVAELSEHENVVGIKDSRGDLDLLARLLEAVRPGFQVLVGDGARFYGALEVGAVGGILAVANLAPDEAAEIHRAARSQRGSAAGRIQERIAPLHTEIVGRRGVPGVKAALELLGYRAGPPRSPLPALPERERDRVAAVLQHAGFLDDGSSIGE